MESQVTTLAVEYKDRSIVVSVQRRLKNTVKQVLVLNSSCEHISDTNCNKIILKETACQHSKDS